MNSEQRLAEIALALEQVGLCFLVMGGQAARFYGVGRQTLDFDVYLAPEGGPSLVERLSRTSLFGGAMPTEGPSWRRAEFRRFLLGHLPDGREEWIEFWLKNHLLAPFEELAFRREVGEVAGHWVSFLSLPDLIRSKETEREDDWQDVVLLEEILDLRNLANIKTAADALLSLANLRSQRGFRLANQKGLLDNPSLPRQALARAVSPITCCYLRPFVTEALSAAMAGVPSVIAEPLESVAPGSVRHLALVEAMRRVYRQAAMAADRADKLRAASM
jgi:hypothetical protein